MRRRLLRYTLLMALIPFGSIIMTLMIWNRQPEGLVVLLLGSLAQVSVILLCKNNTCIFIRPAIDALERMNVKRIPAPYEPGKYVPEYRACAVAMWLSTAAPAAACLAGFMREEVTITILNSTVYAAPSMNLLLLAVFCAVVGTVAFPLWVMLGQAMAIYNQAGERKRYLLRGFAEEAADCKRLRLYLAQEKRVLKKI